MAEKMTESPDAWRYTNGYATALDEDAVAFGFYNGKLYHTQMEFYTEWREAIIQKTGKAPVIDSHARIAEAMRWSFRGIFEREEDYGMGLVKPFRELLSPSGRIWVLRDAVSFWELPTSKHIDMVVEAFGLDDNAVIQLTPDGRDVSIGQALRVLRKREGGAAPDAETPTMTDRDRELMKQQHLVPDAKKALARGKPMNFGAAANATVAQKAGYGSAAAFNAARYGEGTQGAAKFLKALNGPQEAE